MDAVGNADIRFCSLTYGGYSYRRGASKRLWILLEEDLRRRNFEWATVFNTRFGARLEKLRLDIDRLPKKGRIAVNYAFNMQSKVFRWREDADFELDNNWCERAARPQTLFRKSSMHTASHRGARIRAILRSFVETCKLEGISIVKYFTAFFKAVCSGRTDYENLLPATST